MSMSDLKSYIRQNSQPTLRRFMSQNLDAFRTHKYVSMVELREFGHTDSRRN
jgi:hypothetical protein